MKERLRLLIDALRSGEYIQAQRYLRIEDRSLGCDCHCVLGVMCEVYLKHNPGAAVWRKGCPDTYSFGPMGESWSSETRPYAAVLDWFGIGAHVGGWLMFWNDSDKLDFLTIAEKLEAWLDTRIESATGAEGETSK